MDNDHDAGDNDDNKYVKTPVVNGVPLRYFYSLHAELLRS